MMFGQNELFVLNEFPLNNEEQMVYTLFMQRLNFD
jgi:hypothetical protein